MSPEKNRAALLIDADNLPTEQVEKALQELERICRPMIRKAFGDFTNSAKSWSADFLLRNGITPVLHFPVSNHKNGADIAMCIAAMDILHARSVEAIILFSSDSDFGPLAAKIRAAGVEAIGVGDKKSGEAFKASFDKFIIVESSKLAEKPEPAKPKPAPKKPTTKNPSIKQKAVPKGVLESIVRIVKSFGDDAPLNKVNAEIKRQIAGFSHTKYGYASISKLLNSMNQVVLTNGNKSVRLAKSQTSGD